MGFASPVRPGGWLLCATLVLAAGCAPAVRSEDVRFEQAGGDASPVVRVQEPIHIHLSTGYSRTIEAASQWQFAGRLPQGAVLRPVNSVFSIEGRQVHEAWLVVKGRQLVGFYLPAESRYSALEPPVAWPTDIH